MQAVILDRLGRAGRARDSLLAELRPALAGLRDAYRAGTAPQYSDLLTRRAYYLAYMPLYAAALEALYLRSSAWDQLARKRSLSIGSLGAGPGTEVLAFAGAMARAGVDCRIESVVAVDRCAAWEDPRWWVLKNLNLRIGNAAIGDIVDVLEDMGTATGRFESLNAVRRCDVVLMSGLLSELDLASRDAFFTGMRHRLERGAWLFVSDFPGSNQYDPARTVMNFRGLSSRDVIGQVTDRIDRQHPDLERSLYGRTDGLWPQRTFKPHMASFLLET